MHYWHEKNNAVFVDAGVWLRPRYYKQGNENLFEASKREAKNVRQNVGVCDVTTLGKIDIKGPDAAELLNRVYTNAWLKLPVGKARYGVMLREDGIVMDGVMEDLKRLLHPDGLLLILLLKIDLMN